MQPVVNATAQSAAKLIVSGMTPISCTVAEISEQGATLKVGSVFGIPDRFDIVVGARRHECRMIEKATNKLKVLFET